MEKLSNTNKYQKVDVDSLKLDYTEVSEIPKKLERLRNNFYNNHKSKDIKYRKTQLLNLKKGIEAYKKEIVRSNQLDLGLNEFATEFNHLMVINSDIDYIINNFESWAKPEKVDSPILLAPASSYLFPEPYGVCTIFSAWNSQYLTLLQPIAAAIAAGNCVIAKPSEMAPYSAKLLEYILGFVDSEIIDIIQGGADQCIELTKNRSDIIIFTGSPMKGVLVAAAAAKYLTPCILELGGQNPVVVDEDADIKCAAYNLVNGRFIVSGQACISPEYVMVNRKVFDKLCTALAETTELMFSKDPKNSSDYSRIINDWHTDRLSDLVNNHKGEVVVSLGSVDKKEKFVPPTIVKYKSIQEMEKSLLAKEEIFGPIMYLTPYDDIEECIKYINRKEKPLAMYYFGFNKKHKDMLVRLTSSGGLVMNDTLVQFANHHLPFGGVGNSGYSAYHGKFGFFNLSHLKPVMDRSSGVLPLRYPPFTSSKISIMKKAFVVESLTQNSILKFLVYFSIVIFAFVFRNNFVNAAKGFIGN